MSNGLDISLSYIDRDDIFKKEYKDFIEMYHGRGTYSAWKERILWYFSLGENLFRILVAKSGNRYVGQSCAYHVCASICSNNYDLWWGIDAFVLSEMRGKGIGKQLQGQLHRDLPNFSSAWYSPTNGIIKRKCGDRGILDLYFGYYPVSCFFSISIELAIKKIVSRKLSFPRFRLPFFYSSLFFKGKRLKEYLVEELPVSSLPSLSGFIESCISNTQFHIIRTYDYLQWKYVDNPRMNCHVLSISKSEQLVGLIVFSDVKEGGVVMAKARIVKIYESVFTKGSLLTHEQCMLLVVDYFRNNNQGFDGIMSLQNLNYWPSLIYPRPSSELLSSCSIDKLKTGYITYSDQDME